MILLVAGAFKVNLARATASSSDIAPVDNAITLETQPSFNVTPISDSDPTLDVILVLGGVGGFGGVNIAEEPAAPTGVPLSLISSSPLTPSSTKYVWSFNITDSGGTVNTGDFNIGVGSNFECPVGDILTSGTYNLIADSSGVGNINLPLILVNTATSNLAINGDDHSIDNNIEIKSVSGDMMRNVSVANFRINSVADPNRGNIEVYSQYGSLFDVTLANITFQVGGDNRALDLYSASGYSISNVTVANCTTPAILVEGDSLYNSVFANNSVGIFPNAWGPDNRIMTFYNNLFNSTVNVDPTDDLTETFWNTTQQVGTRIYSAGTDIGGNFWAHPDGSGESQTGTDANHDGFLDSPVEVVPASGIYDYLPYSLDYVVPSPSSTPSPTTPTGGGGGGFVHPTSTPTPTSKLPTLTLSKGDENLLLLMAVLGVGGFLVLTHGKKRR